MTFVVLLYFLFNTKVVFAAKFHQEGDNVVYKESVTLDDLSENSFTQWGWSPSSGMYVYKIDDKTGIPTGSVINGMCFFKYGDDDKFGAIASSQFIALIVNRGLGLVLSDEKLQTFYTAYLQNISGAPNNKAGSLVDSNGNVLGLCLNDISGCVYDAYPQNTNIDIPSQEVNNVYNYYQYYIDVVDPRTPDYINIQTYNLNTVSNLLDVTNSKTVGLKSIINTIGNGLALYFYHNGNTQTLHNWTNTQSSSIGIRYLEIDGRVVYPESESHYDNFCNDRGLIQNGAEIGYTSLISSAGSSLRVYFYDLDSALRNINDNLYTADSNGSFTLNTVDNNQSITLCAPNFIPTSKDSKIITVYRNSNIVTQITNKTYSPSTFTSTTYNNYDTNTDNSISTNTSVVNNSTETNNTIYNDASESFSEYYSSQDNYNIDNSVVIENTTEIIYNYYGNDNGGGGGSDDNDDDPIWDALLKAIVDFFKKIGQLIAALLTGLLELINTVLDAFANINNSFEGIKNFLSSIFSWFPSEIVTLMVLGLGLALLASFITWFKR